MTIRHVDDLIVLKEEFHLLRSIVRAGSIPRPTDDIGQIRLNYLLQRALIEFRPSCVVAATARGRAAAEANVRPLEDFAVVVPGAALRAFR